MSRALVISVRLHNGRYHGSPEWPPSPARLFQALLSGAAVGDLADNERRALVWLESLGAPTIGSPVASLGQGFTAYVPNNDLDAVGHDPGRTSEVRVGKWTKPRLLPSHSVFLYCWVFPGTEDDEQYAREACAIADRLYQFGRGVDMACAWGQVVDAAELTSLLSNYSGLIYRPSAGAGGGLPCPEPGSLASLETRYALSARRFKTEGMGKGARQLFAQPPRPRFARVAYVSPPSRRVCELRDGTTADSFGVWPLARVSRLTVWLRDGAVERLRRALPDQASEIERVMVGRKADGAADGPVSARVRIVPLPSIGHDHADRRIRRVLIEVPAGCSLRADDVHWAFSGLDISDPETGEVADLTLTPSSDESMLAHYGAGDRRFRIWRTVTPAALPESAKRRRIDPARMTAEAKDGTERAAEQSRAASAVGQALRHAEVRTRVEAIRLQREPFEARGEPVEAFAPGTRFAKERLWHVEIAFEAPIAGPLVIGDGRFLGLGVMAPVSRTHGVHAFVVEDGLVATPSPIQITRALRRAVMARVQQLLGPRANLPGYLTGHERDGSPLRSERGHLTFLFDPASTRLLIVAPHLVEGREPTREETNHLADLDDALDGFRELLAGPDGRLMLRAASMDGDTDPLFAASRVWETVTSYEVTRHAKKVAAAEALSSDILAECRRQGLPVPRVTVFGSHGITGVGLVGRARLTFEVAVPGPIVLGRSRYLGGGLFSGRSQ